MCVAAFAWQPHPRWRVVAIANRDEHHARPATPLARWSDRNAVIAGRDLQSGGSWLGVGEASGRFALITNLGGYGTPNPDKASRGALLADWLEGAGRYADPTTADLNGFNPFNLLLADRERAVFLSNKPKPFRTELPPGLYGLSNGALDEPWPKVLQLKSALREWLTSGDDAFEPLFAALRDESLGTAGVGSAEPSDGPRQARQTPPFIRHPIYGTRCSTVVAVDRDGLGTISERSFDAQGNVTGEARAGFAWPALALGAASP